MIRLRQVFAIGAITGVVSMWVTHGLDISMTARLISAAALDVVAVAAWWLWLAETR